MLIQNQMKPTTLKPPLFIKRFNKKAYTCLNRNSFLFYMHLGVAFNFLTLNMSTAQEETTKSYNTEMFLTDLEELASSIFRMDELILMRIELLYFKNTRTLESRVSGLVKVNNQLEMETRMQFSIRTKLFMQYYPNMNNDISMQILVTKEYFDKLEVLLWEKLSEYDNIKKNCELVICKRGGYKLPEAKHEDVLYEYAAVTKAVNCLEDEIIKLSHQYYINFPNIGNECNTHYEIMENIVIGIRTFELVFYKYLPGIDTGEDSFSLVLGFWGKDVLPPFWHSYIIYNSYLFGYAMLETETPAIHPLLYYYHAWVMELELVVADTKVQNSLHSWSIVIMGWLNKKNNFGLVLTKIFFSLCYYVYKFILLKVKLEYYFEKKKYLEYLGNW